MKLIHWLLWPESARSRELKKTGIKNRCHGGGFLSCVFWLAPQVCILPCWAAMSGLPEVPER